jgi:hypothetical protein
MRKMGMKATRIAVEAVSHAQTGRGAMNKAIAMFQMGITAMKM